MAELKFSEYINKSPTLVKKPSMKDVKVAFLSNFTITGLAETFKVLCYEHGIFIDCYTAPYNQYQQEILNKSSQLYKFNPDIIFILLDGEQLFSDFYYFPYRMSEEQRKQFIENQFKEIKNLISILKENTNAKIVINSFLVPHYSSRGIIENKQKNGIRSSIQALNSMLESLSHKNLQLFVFDTSIFCSKIGYENLVDKRLYYYADMKIAPKALVKLANEYLAYIIPLASMTKKCIVLDLDNTIWGGIIGEDGIANIKLGPEKDGKPYFGFQKRLLELHERGIILAINSRNNYKEAIDAIKNHKYMVLKEEHFASIKINWEDKATNIREIAKEVNIGLESMVYIDDDVRNREMIKELIPEVFVVEMPNDYAMYPEVIENLKMFNTFNITSEDLNRGKMYLSQKKREQLKSKVQDLNSFIKMLGIEIDISKANNFTIPRIAQLTQRTNQFNLTTNRYSEEDIKKLASDGNHLVYGVNVKDKFGDNGLTGTFIINKKFKEKWVIDTFLLSCRVLGRDIEKAMLNELISMAHKEGVKELIGKYFPTQKNMQTAKFYAENGFKHLDENTFLCENPSPTENIDAISVILN
ncbi:HAD-IIIC family phosphatase [Candidatus Woesearchaeota archaeon]|nr:HAD-IIIC family phosphatase [Candidatus Woesearchaeota archaeon]